MVEPLAVISIAIPLIACAAFALFMVVNRTRFLVLRGKLMDALLAGIIALLAGMCLVLAGTAYSDVSLANAGLAATGVAMGALCLLAIPLLQLQERQRGEHDAFALSAELATAQARSIVRAAEAAGIGVMVAEARSKGEDAVISMNAQAASLLGLEQGALLGAPLSDMIAMEDRANFARLKERVRAHPGTSASLSLSLFSAGGEAERVPVELGVTFETAGKGGAYGITLIDSRAKRTALAAAREARSDAEFYLDLVTHDLSNFNQGALGYLELIDMAKEPSPAKVERFQKSALVQIRNCARLIERVKLLSVIRESREPIGPTDALYALHDAIDQVVFAWTEKDVEVRLVPMTAVHTVRADAWLKDLFANLLDNAAKFSPGNRVEVAVSVADGEGGKSLTFRIADHGKGIPPEERAVILDRIGSRKRDYSAYRSGIGLFIVKTIADRYGARLWIEDRVPHESDKGCVFCLEIPSA